MSTHIDIHPGFPPEVIGESDSLKITDELTISRKPAFGLVFADSWVRPRAYSQSFEVKILPDGYLLNASVSDVDYLVKPGSLVDIEARRRMFTLFYKDGDRYAPLLPGKLSELRLSLVQLDYSPFPRPTVTFHIPLSPTLEMGHPSAELTYSKNPVLYTHSEVYFGDIRREGHRTEIQKLTQLAQRLLEQRQAKGALAFFDPELGWYGSEEGDLRQLAPEQARATFIVNQELGLLTNLAATRILKDHDQPAIWRNHFKLSEFPEREEWQETIEKALAEGDIEALKTFQEKLRATGNRGSYQTRTIGHYGLSVDQIAQINHPLSKFPDLINLRIIKACLSGESSPYTEEDLKVMASRATGKERGAVIETKRILKKAESIAAASEALDSLDKSALSSLNSAAFIELVRNQTQKENLTNPIKTELLRRIQESSVTDQEAYFILIEGRHLPEWAEITPALLGWIKTFLPAARVILDRATQTQRWEHLKFSSSNRQGQYITQTMLATPDQDYISAPYSSDQEKLTTHAGCLEILAKITGHPIPPQEIQQLLDQRKLVRAPKHNRYIFQIEALGHKENNSPPRFEITESGSAYKPVFTAQVQIDIKGETIVSDPVQASSKRDAKQLACHNLLQKMGQA